MLKEAIDLQTNAVNKILEVMKLKKEITFKAPTGSGKTYMMASFMDETLASNKDVVFLVSTLSKGNLAEQNYNKFLEYSSNGDFSNLNSYLINTDISGEEGVHIPVDYNVYLLPRDLYKAGGKLMQGAMESFLNTVTFPNIFGGLDKKIYLIKDESHIATRNLDSISEEYFDKIINVSATPNLKRGQLPDVEITDEEAVSAKLIKRVEHGDDNDTIGDAINKFEEIKDSYRNLLGVNPCLIIQISNKDKADYELNNVIFPELNKPEHNDLKWMLIVDKDKDCDTNDVFKAKKMPVNKWKDYAKSNTSTIDVIIFKMVISEGWDIPRACMLYQVRDTQSKQLDEQVMGRVRRNPRLLDFEDLSTEAQKLATTAWVWGLVPSRKKHFGVKLWDEPSDITEQIKIKTTRLKPLTHKTDFNLSDFVDKQLPSTTYNDIFSMYKKLKKSDDHIKNMCYKYSSSYEKWFKFNANLEKITIENNKYICNYNESMEILRDSDDRIEYKSPPILSSYMDNGNYININDWIWKRTDGNDKFSFDSDAEREWASIIKDLCSIEVFSGERAIKRIDSGKNNPNAGKVDLFGEIEPAKINPTKKFLWGKNYLPSSEINFEYYLEGLKKSYPDFIMKDSFNRIHIFEVKSLNVSSSMPHAFDSQKYKEKMEELKKCYKQASLLTGHIFYLPILKEDVWYINQFHNGGEKTLTKEQFVSFIKTN